MTDHSHYLETPTDRLDHLPESAGCWSYTPQDTPARDALHATLRRAIDDTLTAKQREVVLLYFFDDLTQPQIAERLGVSQQVVSKRLFGVRRRGRHVGGAIARLRRALTTSPALRGTNHR